MAEDPVIPADLNTGTDESDPVDEGLRCLKLNLPKNIAAFFKNEKLDRDTEQILCDPSLLENITGNYIIVKKIISFLQWQDQLLCRNVCSMWRSAVNTLQKEQLYPSDFAISLRLSHVKNGITLISSENFNTEPLAVFAFANTAGYTVSRKCEMYVPCPCDPPCVKEHYLIDVLENQVVSPKKCLLSIKSCNLSYMPLPQTITYKHAINRQRFGKSSAFIAGLYMPVIPNIEFKVIDLKCFSDLKRTFFMEVDELTDTRLFKGILVFVNESFLLHTVEEIVFINYFKCAQPDIPFALGGCIVEDTLSDKRDMDTLLEGINLGIDLNSENLVSIGVFTVPKNSDDYQPDNGCKFDMFSLIIESCDWSKAKIQNAINEFSRKVPHFEHSVVIKMSCVGRDQKHNYEQDYFRAAFPTTRLIGCYGNGELGINHPPRPPSEEYSSSAPRHRRDPGPQYGVMYSYSTVFVYIGWGKILIPPQSA